MNFLITGANGFIGSNLVNELIKKDNKIYSVVRKKNNNISTKNTIVIADLSKSNWTDIITKKIDRKIDIVIHLAQSKEYRNFPDGAEDMFNINIKSTFELLEWCRKNNIKKFIFASTGNVYKSSNKSLSEDNICEPNSMYGVTKLCAEKLVEQYSTYFTTVILRIFGVYGPGQKDMLIPNIINKVINNDKILLAKNRGIVITPIYITDAIQYILKLININININISLNHICLNLCGIEKVTLSTIVKIISYYLGNNFNNIEITNNPVTYLVGACNKIQKKTKYKAKIDIKEGIKLILNDMEIL